MPTEAEALDSFDHHVPTADQQARIQRNRQAYKAVARVLMSTCRAGKDRDNALLQLRSSMFFANASVALEGGVR